MLYQLIPLFQVFGVKTLLKSIVNERTREEEEDVDGYELKDLRFADFYTSPSSQILILIFKP